MPIEVKIDRNEAAFASTQNAQAEATSENGSDSRADLDGGSFASRRDAAGKRNRTTEKFSDDGAFTPELSYTRETAPFLPDLDLATAGKRLKKARVNASPSSRTVFF